MRILLAAQTFEGASGWHIERTLKKMGQQVLSFNPGFLLVPPSKGYYNLAENAQRQMARIANRLKPMRGIILDATNRRLLRLVRAFQPDLLLAIKGEHIDPQTIDHIRKMGICAINWCFDDPFLWLEQPVATLLAYDHFLLVDRAYIEKIQARVPGAQVSYLPQCCDPDIHKTVPLSPEERQRYGNDVCFVGSMYPYRVQTLIGLGDFDVGIWGNFWKHAPNADLRNAYRGREVYGIEKARVFNASKIILNTHHPQAIRATNLRTYEVTGCGAFLLSDRRQDLTVLYREGKEFVGFEGTDDLRDKIKYYLSHAEEREQIARQGQKRAYAEHTYEIRLQKLLGLVSRNAPPVSR